MWPGHRGLRIVVGKADYSPCDTSDSCDDKPLADLGSIHETFEFPAEVYSRRQANRTWRHGSISRAVEVVSVRGGFSREVQHLREGVR